MCGIAGLVGREWTHDEFQTLFDAIRHRGPDGAGIVRRNGLQLGMNRLRFRGPDAPLPVQEGGFVCGFNGQVYGLQSPDGEFLSLRDGIEHEAHALRCDRPAVDGMYACAIASGDGASVSLATDPYFIKPIFLSQSAKGVAFCSEFAPLLRLSPVNRLDRDALAELFTYGWYLGSRTCISGIHLGNRQDILVNGNGHAQVARRPRVSGIERSRGAGQDLRQAIHDSVRRCIEGAGPFGLAVSGGLDSSILAWELNDLGAEDLVTLSVRFAEEEDGIDSLRELRLPPGGAWETWRHRIVHIEDDQIVDDFARSTRHFGQPSTMSSLPLYQRLAEAAAEEGVRVLLTGEGADELFGGYASYAKVKQLPSILSYYQHPQRDALVRILFGEPAALGVRQRFMHAYRDHTDLRAVECEIRLERLLLRADVCLMSQSIEGRVPFLHNRIPEMALALGWDELVTGPGKTALRDAYRNPLGERACQRKTRFKTSDRVLRTCLADARTYARLLEGTIPAFGEAAARRALDALATDGGFDADVCCLLFTLAFLMEEGRIDAYAA